jgi:G2/mitotic-specific cyclin 1/2
MRHTRTTSSDIAKNTVVNPKEALKPTLSTTTTTRARPALAQQRVTSNTSSIVAKRKRDALGDATNGKGKAAASSLAPKAAGASVRVNKPSSTATSSTTANTTRASSVSTQTKENIARTAKENAVRARPALGVKPKNVVNAAPLVKDEKESLKEVKVGGDVNEKTATRRPLAVKGTHTTTTTLAVKSRKETHTVEKKTRVVPSHSVKEERVEVKEEIDEEDAARVHKRPRLSEIEEVEVKELENVTVEKVQKVLETTFVKPEDEVPDDLDKDDVDDPLMVAEYVVEIFDYLFALEVWVFSPLPNIY